MSLPYQFTKFDKILKESLQFRDNFCTFRAENTPKSWPLKCENNAQTNSKQFPKQLWISPKNDFFDNQIGYTMNVNIVKNGQFLFKFQSTSSKIASLPKKIKKTCAPT